MADHDAPLSEGMVAIVTGLEDAGLSVTVRDARAVDAAYRRGSARASTMRSQGHLGTVSSGVQTISPAGRSRSTTDVNRPNAYVSTYQRAYGPRAGSQSPPTSPGCGNTTLDIQQLNEQLNELRARIYANGSNAIDMNRGFAAPPPPPVHSPTPVHSPSAPLNTRMTTPARPQRVAPVRDTACYRSSINLDRAKGPSSSHHRRDMRVSDAFVESLRKYPSSTDPTPSADIIQRLLSYTQTKNSSKKSRPKKVQSLTRHSREGNNSHDARCSHDARSSHMMKSSNKNVQTYTRTRNASPRVSETVYGKAERRRRVSPAKSERSEGSPTGHDSTSYDYLKIGSFARNSDVRYLTDVPRYVRDTLRFVCNNDEVPCPRMLDRYSAHRREQHSSEVSTLTVREMDEFAQTSGLPPKRSRRICRFSELPYTDSCKHQPRSMGESIRMKMSEIKEKMCVICNQPSPCICDKPPCPCPENRPIKFKERVKNINVCEEFRRLCTQEPIFENCTCPQDVDENIDKTVDDWIKNIPIYASYTLMEKVTRDKAVSELKENIRRHIGDENKCKDDALNCLKNLPMWLPPDKEEQDSFQEQLVCDLIDQTHKIDIFAERVRKWVQGLPFLSEAKVDKDKLVKELTKRLKDTAMTTKDLRHDLKSDAYDVLQRLPIKSCTCLETEQLADKIAHSISSLPPEVIDSLKYSGEFSYVRKQVEFTDKIRRWVNKVPFEPSANVNREAFTQELVEELVDIMKRTDPGSLWDAVKGFAQKKLHKMPVQGGYGEMAHQSAKLADQLTSDMFAEVVSNWAKTIAFDHDANVVPDIFAHEITRHLTSIMKNLEPEEIEDTLNKYIFDKLNALPASGSIPLKVAQAGRLASALSKLGRKDAGKIKETIKNWLKEVPFETDADPSVDKPKVVNNLTYKIKEKIETIRPEEIWSEIKKVTIEELMTLPVDDSANTVEPLARKLADNIVAFMFDDAVFGWARSVPFKQGAIDLDAFSTDLCKKLKDAVMYEEPEIFEKQVRAIALESLPNDLLTCSPEEKSKLIEDLVDTMNNTPNKRDKIAATVGNWYKKVPLSIPVSREKVKDFVRKLKLKLTKTSPRELWDALKQAAIEEIEHSQTECLSTDIEVLGENLANMLAPEEFEEIIREWAETITFDRKTDESVDTLTRHLTKKLKDAIAENDINDVHDQLRNIIFDELSMTAVMLDEIKKAEEAERLINNLKKIYPDRDGILIIIENWTKTLPFKPEVTVNKIKITKELARTFKEKIETIQEPEDVWFVLSEMTQERLEKLPIDTTSTSYSTQRFGEHLADMILTHLLSHTIRSNINMSYFDHKFNVNIKELVNHLTKEVEKIIMPKTRDKYKELVRDVIAERLHHEPLMCTTNQIDKIAYDMGTEISSLPWKPDFFSKTLRNWVKTAPFSLRALDKYKFATDLGKKLRNTFEKIPASDVRDIWTSDITDSLKKADLKCNEEEKSSLIENLVEQLIDSLYIDTVFNWLKNVPSKSDTPLDRATLSKKIMDKLKPLLLSDNPDKKILIKHVNDECTQVQLENDSSIEQNLIKKLLKLPKNKPVKQQKFAINVSDWLKGVTLTLTPEDNEALIKNTLDKLRDLRSEGKDEGKIREEIKQDIKIYVDKVFQGQKTDPEAKKNLVNKLVKQVFGTFQSVGQERRQALLPKFKESIKQWWKEYQKLSKTDTNMNDELMATFASKLADVAIAGGNQKLVRSKITKIISDTIDIIDSKLQDQPDEKNKLLKRLSDKIAADIGILLTEGKTESQYRVEAMHKGKSHISAVETLLRNQSLAHRISDLNTQEQSIPNGEQSMFTINLDESENITFQNKSTFIDELLKDIETKANINRLVITQELNTGPCVNIGPAQDCRRKINKSIERISQLSSSTFSEHQMLNIMVREKIAQNITRTLTRLLSQGYDIRRIKSEMVTTIKEEIGQVSDIGTDALYKQVNKLIDKHNKTIKLIQSTELKNECLQKSSGLRMSVSSKDQKTSLQKSEDDESISNIRGTYDDLDKNIETISIDTDVSTYHSSDVEPEKTLENSLKTDMTTLFESVPELLSSTPTEKVEFRNVCKALASRLTKVSLQDLDRKQTRKKLQKEIVDALEYILKCKGEQLTTKTKLMLANHLLEILAVYKGVLFYTSMTRTLIHEDDNDIKHSINRWMQKITDPSISSSFERKKVEKVANALVKSIENIKLQNLARQEIKNKLLCEIKDKLDAALKYIGKQFDKETKQTFADNLLEELLETINVSKCSSFCATYENQPLLRAFVEDLEKWVESMPIIPGRTYVENILDHNKIIHHLSVSLKKMLSQGLHSKYIEKVMVSKIKDELDNVYDENNDVHEKNKLVDDLLDKLHKRLGQFEPGSSRVSLNVKNELTADENSRTLIGQTSKKVKGQLDIFNKLENAFKKDITEWIKDNLDIKSMTAIKQRASDISDTLKNISESKEKRNDTQHIKKTNAKRTESADYKRIYSDQSLYKQSLERINRSSSRSMTTTKTIKNVLPHRTEARQKNTDQITKSVEEDCNFRINNNIQNKNQYFKRFGKVIDIQNKDLQQPDNSLSEGKNIYTRTRRSLTNLLMNRLGEKSSSVDILAVKAMQNDVKAWFDDIPELKGTNATEKAKHKKLLRNLTKNLTAHLQSVNLDKEDIHRKMALKIKRNLDAASKGKGLNSKSKDKLVEDLLTKISESIENRYNSTTAFRKIVISTQDAKEILTELLPEIFLNKPSNNRELEKLSRNLAKLFNELQTSDIENKVIRNKILTKIKDQLDTTFRHIENLLSLKGTYTIAESLLDVVLESVAKTDKQLDISKVFQKDVLNWLEDIPETASTTVGERRSNSKTSLVLAKKLKDIYSSGIDDKHLRRELLDEIRNHLEVVLEKRGVIMQSKEINKLANKLVNNFTILPAPVQKTDTQDSIIWEWVNGIPILSHEYMPEKRKKINELSKVLQKIQKKCISSYIKKDEMRKEINRWLKDVSNKKHKQLDEYTKHNYITKLVENMQTKSFPSKHIKVKDKPRHSNDFGYSSESIALRKTVGRFNTTPSEIFYQVDDNTSQQTSAYEISREIDSDIQAKIFGLIAHNMDVMDVPEEAEIIRVQIIKLLMVGNELPEDEAKQLAQAILQNAKLQAQNAETDEKLMLMLLRQEIRKIMADFSIDADHRDEVEAFLMDLEVRRLFEGESYEDGNEEILKLLIEKGGLSHEDAIKMLSQLGGDYDKIMEALVKSKSKGEKKGKGGLKPGGASGKAGTVEGGFRRSSDVARYKSGLENVIENWLDDIPIDQDTIADKVYKDEVVQDLSGTILEREKYLQENPNEALSDDKEREHLKGDCNKWLEKFLDDDDLDIAKDRVDDLITAIKGITVPQLTDEPGKTGKVPMTYHDAIQDEILKWVAGLPPHLQPNIDDNTLRKRVKDLANRIEKQKRKPDAEEKIRAIIDDVLPQIFEDQDPAELKRLGSSLFNILMKNGFTDDTWTPPDIPTYQEALQDEIMDWVDELPPHLKPKIGKDALKKIVKDLANQIEKHKGKPDAEEKIRAEIAKVLPSMFKGVEGADLKRLESSLLNVLMKKGFTDDTWTPPDPNRKEPTYHDALQDEILKWIVRLPPDSRPNIDNNTLKKHVKDLANRIGKHKGKPDAEEKIRAEIGKVFPLIFEDEDPAELKRLGSSLLNVLMKKGFTDDTWTPPDPNSPRSKSGKGGKVPTYNEALQDEIMDWVNALPPHLRPKISDDALGKLVKDLANQIEKHKGKSDAEEKIRTEIAKVLPTMFKGVKGADLKALESSLFNALMKKGFTDDTWRPPVRQNSELVEQGLINSVQNWLKQTPLYQKASPEEKKQMELAAIEMAKGIKRAVSVAKLTPGADMDDLVREQVLKDLKNLVQDPKLRNDEDFMNKTADSLLNYMKGQKMYQDLAGKPAEAPLDLLGHAVNEWVRKLPIEIKTPHEQERFDNAKGNFISRLKQARSQFNPSTPEHDQAIKDEARKFLRANITDPKKKFDEKYIEDKANELVKTLHSVPIESDDTTRNTIKPYRSPADTLYEYIENWVQDLPVEGDPEKVNLMKQELASKLVNKIGELNLNPDVFNDADLYEDLLQDEINKLLAEIPPNPELNKYLPALKKDLISKIMDARQRMLEELAGKVYKQHLRDKISSSLPLPSCLTTDELASLELLKDKVADAFINLHYATCDESENKRYKTQISNELNKFINDVFRHYPCAQLDVDKLKNDLYTALTKVPVPRDDSMKSEVEQVRIRDLIYDWMREIPLRQETATEKLHRFKLAAVLAKKLHDIEMEKLSNDFVDSEHKIGEEITRFLNKVPLRQGQDSAIPDLVQQLMYSLKYTEKSRRFFSSSSRCQPNDTGSADFFIRYPSTLSPEDQDHLRRIKLRRQCHKDIGVCPPLADTSSQTDHRGHSDWIERKTCPGVKRVSSPKHCTAIPQTKNASCMTPKESPCHMHPRVLVKEFMWESPDNCSQNTALGIQTSPTVLESERPYHCPLEQSHTYDSFAAPLGEPMNVNTGSPCSPKASISPHSICPRQSPYNYTSSPKQYLDQPSMTDRFSQNPCHCPEKRRPIVDDEEFSSEDEYVSMGPGPSRYYRRPDYPTPEVVDKRSCGRRFTRWPNRFENTDMFNPCMRYRTRRECFRPMVKDNKCNCKERVYVNCKGHGNRYADMCQACGNTCPHPRPMFFK